jgi:hypothetical protein
LSGLILFGTANPKSCVAWLARGDLMVSRPKIHRKLIARVIMGPAAMFTLHTISDDIAAHPMYHLWGVLLEKDNDIDLPQFLQQAYADVDDELFVGRIVPGQPSTLTCSSDWTDESFLSFGKEVKAGI